MIDNLQALLKSKYDYKLEEYAVYDISKDGKSYFKFTAPLFLVALVLYILDVSGVIENFVGIVVLIISAVVFLGLPFFINSKKMYNTIIVTPRFLIQRTDKESFQIVEFDNITKFHMGKEGVTVKDSNDSVLLGLGLYREELEPIIDILEAKGKTFDKSKEYMVRPIIIKISNNKIQLFDDVTETEDDLVYQDYAEDFKFLTPGFAEEINFHNSMVEDIRVDGKNVGLFLASFEVKGGHPENTTFGSIQASDCVMVFVNTKLKKVVSKDLNEKGKPEEVLPNNIEATAKMLENAVVNEWRFLKNSGYFEFSAGVHILRITFEYDEVIIGWNEQK